MAESTAAVITMLHGELGKAGKDEKAKLRVSRFRDNNKLMSSLLIDYRRNFDRVRFVRRPTDVETGADADEEPGEDAV